MLAWEAALTANAEHQQAERVFWAYVGDSDAGSPACLLVAGFIAESWHAQGECVKARGAMRRVWTDWERHHRDSPSLGLALLRVYHTMLLACGYPDLADDLLTTVTGVLPVDDLYTPKQQRRRAAQAHRAHRTTCTQPHTTDPTERLDERPPPAAGDSALPPA